MLLLCVFTFRHIDMRSEHFNSFFISRIQWAAYRLNMFDRSIWKYDSELERKISFLTQGLLSLCIRLLAIIWMYPLQHSLPARKTLRRIKTPYSITFLRPINRRRRIEHQGAGVAQPLCLGQIGLAAPQRFFCPFSFSDMASHSAIADKMPRPIEYWQPRNGHIALAAIGCSSRKLKVPKRQVGIERFAMLAPGFSVRLEVRHFPAGLSHLGARRRCVS